MNAKNQFDFSLFYFANDDTKQSKNKYRLLLEGAKFADANGFSAVWTPERHFHAFGGLYPNPSIVSAALAAITKNIKIRAGSCVLPLHNPIRVAEDWSVIDNLSNGRVGMAIASGWQPNDYVLAPENFARSKEIMSEHIGLINRLWAGEEITQEGPNGPVRVKTLPRPIQNKLPLWITAPGNPDTFKLAGKLGASVLTHLLGQDIDQLKERIALYRETWEANNHPPGESYVTLMLHTFIGDDADEVKEVVRPHMESYLKTSFGLISTAAENSSLLKIKKQKTGMDFSELMKSNAFTEEELDDLVKIAFERYYHSSGLLGTPESCQTVLGKLADANVDEVACLIDFGIDSQTVLEHLPNIKKCHDLWKKLASPEEEKRERAPNHRSSRSDQDKDESFIQLMEESVERYPDKSAYHFQNTKFTYRVLNCKANQFANYLRSLGTEKGDRIGICLERGADMITCLWGCMKCQATYIPLDPEYPVDRIHYILDDAKPKLIISMNQILNDLDIDESSAIDLEKVRDTIKSCDEENLKLTMDPHAIVYTIYTSGSTGKPKGVEVRYGGLSNLLNSTRKFPGISVQDTLLAVTTISFDIAGLELYLPIVCGASCMVVPQEFSYDAQKIIRLIEEEDVTFMQATPSTWRMLVNAGWKGKADMKCLCGGEALPQDLATQLLKRCQSLWNMYGPTETTIWSTIKKIEANGIVSIGRPIENTSVYILDGQLKEVSLGETGELYIGGSGLARGYLGLEALTEERFIRNPFGDNKRDRLYKTGDRVRRLENHDLEYIGRRDFQIKLNGHRVELGEIEQLIRERDEIDDVVVIVREHSDQVQQLYAFVVNTPNMALDKSDLRSYLQSKLPIYMVPSFIEEIKAFPLTPNGKVDRNALIVKKHKVVSISSVKPVLITMTEIWEKLLNISPIDVNHSFYELGGHSFLMIKAINEIEEKLGFRIKLRDLFYKSLEKIIQIYAPEATRRDTGNSVEYSTPLTPHYFGNSGEKLFGCLHRPRKNSTYGRSVLICNPIGHEYLRAHRCLFKLANDLAEQGCTVLRFDYSGCGESEGNFEKESIQNWANDLQIAKQFLLDKTKNNNCVLVGLRAGASVIQHFETSNNEGDDVVLWEPIVNGADYLNQIIVENKRLLLDRYDLNPRSDQGLLGYVYSKQLSDEIRNIHLKMIDHTVKNKLYLILNKHDLEEHAVQLVNSKSNLYVLEDEVTWNTQLEASLMPFKPIQNIVRWITGEKND